ncbi:hypothetical protein O181_010723 [Austropuccinia psidii MF-1]|uniref:Uncharacterized protein n=1 Tax=Austropuccinia psidii MF-1 TaxID=1389203 RepID=A0A9Q3GKM6_9BASI|nr:hypothetical protein [Austropuccinia psidii MF-1]
MSTLLAVILFCSVKSLILDGFISVGVIIKIKYNTLSCHHCLEGDVLDSCNFRPSKRLIWRISIQIPAALKARAQTGPGVPPSERTFSSIIRKERSTSDYRLFSLQSKPPGQVRFSSTSSRSRLIVLSRHSLLLDKSGKDPASINHLKS